MIRVFAYLYVYGSFVLFLVVRKDWVTGDLNFQICTKCRDETESRLTAIATGIDKLNMTNLMPRVSPSSI